MLDPACMGGKVVFPERTGRIDLSLRDTQVTVPQDEFSRVIQHEFVDTLAGCVRQGGQGPVQDVERGNEAGALVKDVAGTDTDDGPDGEVHIDKG